MSDEQAKSPVPPVPQVMGDDQKAQLRAQLDQIVRTTYVYENIRVLLSQSTFKGEVAQALVEIYAHCAGMLGNLAGQKGVLEQMLAPPPKAQPLRAVPSNGKKRKR